MIRRILLILFIFILVTLVVVWLMQCGVENVKITARVLANPIAFFLGAGSTTGTTLTLPWQISLPQGPDVSGYADEVETDTNLSPKKQYAELADQYDTIQAEVSDAKTFGDPSPYRGKVVIQGVGNANENDPRLEYIELHASSANTAPIEIGGWSLQSAVRGTRFAIPPAARSFYMGVVNAVQNVSLDPDARAIVNSGMSPVGVSFKENICAGYLQQFQNFSPDLNRACPSPEDTLPLTAENLRTYGDGCIDYVRSLPRCTFPDKALPSDLSFACKSFIVNNLSYNGCVKMYQYKPEFFIDLWRIHLGYGRELWNDTHDVIRLLDESGRTVDVLTY